MICPYCGKENPDSLEICDFCGGPLLVEKLQPATDVQPLEPFVEIPQSVPEQKEPDFGPAHPAKPPSSALYGSRVWWIVGCVVFVCLVLACIALVIGIYRSTKLLGFLNPVPRTQATENIQVAVDTATPVLPTETFNSTPVISAQQTPKVLFFDDFSDPNSGWYEEDQADYSTSYFNEAYRIKITADMLISWATPSDHNYGDVIIEADATKNGGPDDNDFGLICRYLDTDRFYYAAISSDGYYGIFKVSRESTVVLGRENMEFSELIQPGLILNTIRFECVGEALAMYVNGQLLDQQTDSEYSTGNVGLIAGTYDTPGTDILFDNFTVYSP